MPTEANSINAATTGIVGNTGTAFTGSPATQYNVQVGGATSSALANVAPSATSGIPLVSAGSSANPSFTTAVVAGGGTGITSATAYGVICGGTTSTGNFQVVTPGTSTYVLTSAGSSALPAWSINTGVGNWVLIQTQTASASASISFTSGLTTYNNLLLIYSNLVTTSNSTSNELVYSTNGGSSYLNSGYATGYNINAYNSNVWTNGNSTAFVSMGAQNSTAAGSSDCGYLYIQDLTSGSYTKVIGGMCLNQGTTPYQSYCLGTQSTGSINAIRFLLSAGNIATGTFSLYGLVQ